MNYGFCMDLSFLPEKNNRTLFESVAKAGFDYVELPFSAISELEDLSALKSDLEKIPCRACNLFFPRSLKIVGNADKAGITAYLEKMLPIAKEIGIETLIFGNGGARKISFSREKTWENLRFIAEEMERLADGISICVEPLNTTETDIINSFGEAVELTKGLKNVAAMIDSYHVAMEKQSFDDVLQNPSRMWHLHTAFPDGRFVPSPKDTMTVYTDFVKTVKSVGYDGKISIEGALRAKDPEGIQEEVKAALDLLKSFFEA